MPKTVLFISHRIPYPPNKGDKIRSFHILKHLGARYDVLLACMVDDPEDMKEIGTLADHADRVMFDRIHPRLKKSLSAGALFRGEPISNRYFYSRKLQREIDAVIAERDIDAVFCFSSPTAEYVFRSRHYPKRLAGSHLYMDFIDVDSYKWQQYAQTQPFPLSWVFSREAVTLRRYEKRIAEEFRHVFFVSEAEKCVFSQTVGNASNATAISNGVDLNYFHPVTPEKGATRSLVFTGAMDYWPNVDGVVWFADAIFPYLRKTFPEVRFYIVGSNPTKTVRDLGQRPGISVTGFVDDVRDYLSLADVCVIPLRIARGIQNKVLEAMAMAKAVVCTPQALDGIDARPGSEVLVAENPDAYVAQVTKLLKDSEHGRRIGQHARQKIIDQYAWSSCLEKLSDIVESEPVN